MNVMPDIAAHAAPQQVTQQEAQQVNDALLAPLSPESPCGPAARHDPIFTDLRLLREEDDPSLPMGQWERPLKRADWVQIETRCVAMLSTRSKDLQIVVWLVEAWMRQQGFAGLCRGLQLLDALLRRYWTGLHPMIDDGDCDARLAPFEWLNSALSVGVRLHATLLVLPKRKSAQISLADWERITAQDLAESTTPDNAGSSGEPEGPLTRADVIEAAQRGADALASTRAAVLGGLEHLQAISAFLDEQLGDESPKLGKLQLTLQAADRLLSQWQPAAQGREAGAHQAHAVLVDEVNDVETAAPAGAVPAAQAHAPQPAAVNGVTWSNRSEAYATLAALAEYLADLEPHSPTPFLIRRAVNWGRMPLPEVIAEVIREEGSLDRLVNVLGLRL
jgi:type VI secretion system protein ImpA